MNKLICFFSFLGCFYAGCAGSSITPNSKTQLNLETADRIQIGAAVRDLEPVLGKPAHVFDIESGEKQALLYCEEQPCNQGDITLHVDKNTQIVKSIFWNPEIKQPEIGLEDVFRHYRGVTFTKQRLLYDYGDWLKELETYSGSNRGIKISYDPKKKTVLYVSRKDPSEPEHVTPSNRKFPIVTLLPDHQRIVNRTGIESTN